MKFNESDFCGENKSLQKDLFWLLCMLFFTTSMHNVCGLPLFLLPCPSSCSTSCLFVSALCPNHLSQQVSLPPCKPLLHSCCHPSVTNCSRHLSPPTPPCLCSLLPHSHALSIALDAWYILNYLEPIIIRFKIRIFRKSLRSRPLNCLGKVMEY